MTEYEVVNGKRYQSDAVVTRVKLMYAVCGRCYTVESECKEGAEIDTVINNIVPPCATQLRIIGVTE